MQRYALMLYEDRICIDTYHLPYEALCLNNDNVHTMVPKRKERLHATHICRYSLRARTVCTRRTGVQPTSKFASCRTPPPACYAAPPLRIRAAWHLHSHSVNASVPPPAHFDHAPPPPQQLVTYGVRATRNQGITAYIECTYVLCAQLARARNGSLYHVIDRMLMYLRLRHPAYFTTSLSRHCGNVRSRFHHLLRSSPFCSTSAAPPPPPSPSCASPSSSGS